MKYKVGDKVCVRSDLTSGKRYKDENGRAEVYCQPSMASLAGQVVTISDIWDEKRYLVSEDKFGWSWTDDMFTGLVVDADPEPQPKPEYGNKYKVGDKVRVRADLTNGKYYRNEEGLKRVACVGSMGGLAGKVVTIKEVFGEDRYRVKEDTGCWRWTEDMFDGLASEPAPEPQEEWSWEDLF